ncbi:MAG TPA: 2,3-bisphosphoglycerate-independent phosphoglycerate mutase [Anaerolineae bacterium]|nr:2,3-bisphosphoglycerate-independent phosphoglycerate mutase [Anaerolineae bacterium]HNU03643.1 2,3-bisphosphoglycerate-independent phosphoglycerate mutase [Anaerolineae bacterium]
MVGKSVKPVALIIMDGWGIREMKAFNAVALGETPNYDRWNQTLERTVLDASGMAVGLPEGQMGNSEVGHLNLGAGRIIYQDFTRINLAIQDGSLAKNQVLGAALQRLQGNQGKLHLIGLFSNGGVHSHVNHMNALIDIANAAGITPVLHLITDGRDTPPENGIEYARALEARLAVSKAVIASVSGRYYTMDRDRRWQRTVLGYDVIARHQGHEGRTASTASEALARSYAEGVTDEFVLPVAIDVGDADVLVKPGDCLLFFNFRADRARQLAYAFAFTDFDGFPRDFIPDLDLLTMTQYDVRLPARIIFPEVEITNPLAEVLSKAGLGQFHAAETEKYPHVTYFFNGGREAAFEGEARHLEPSPKVATYDLQPEMSAYPLAEAVLKRIHDHDDAFILLNFANPDMVGHTGVLEAAIKAVETVDECTGRVVEAIVAKGGVAIVTADHGNCERMRDLLTGEPHTYHTTQPVACFVIGDGYYAQRPRGILADVAPTVLDLLGLPQPAEMTGQSVIEGHVPAAR